MSLTITHLYAITSAINALTSLALGFFILLKKPSCKLNQLWLWMSLAISLWAGGLTVVFLIGNPNDAVALFFIRFANLAALFIPVLYLHFIIVFLNRNDKRELLRRCYILSLLVAATAFSPRFVSHLQPGMGLTTYARAGFSFALFVALYAFEPLYAILLMHRARSQAIGLRRKHITYVMLAGSVGFFLGGTMFPLGFGVPLPPVGGHFIWLYCLLVAWAVFKYQLFDIVVVIRKSLVYSIVVTILTVGYFGIVYAAERVSQRTIGYQSPWISLLAFAAMAFLFQPLKIAIQRVADLLLFRMPQETLVRKIERLEEQALQAEKFKAVSTLAAGMAHEIKNPLTALRTFTEFIPERHQDPEFAKKLHQVFSTETNRIEKTVRELLEFARPKPTQQIPVDFSQLINSTVDLFSGELLKRQVRYSVDCQHNGANLYADPDQLRQVLINLIQNAADAMPDGGHLTLATQSSNSHLVLTVSDTGHGIPRNLLPKIFDPFVSTKPDGTGLGLSVVYSIIQAHHGTIRADSHPGRGTTFIVTLPL